MNNTQTIEKPEPEEKSAEKSKEKPKEKPKEIILRCHCCNKKLKMIHFTCKCNHLFCINHHNPHNHNCQYDYKTEKKKEIQNNNPLIHNKMIKI